VKQRAELDDLVDAWWKTAEAMGVSAEVADESLSSWHAQIFVAILNQCGWTTAEWNEAVVPSKENVV
jgi:hypothetical protein